MEFEKNVMLKFKHECGDVALLLADDFPLIALYEVLTNMKGHVLEKLNAVHHAELQELAKNAAPDSDQIDDTEDVLRTEQEEGE